jgi:hypothetical protein
VPDGSAVDVAIRPDDDHPGRVANYDRRRPEETLLYQVLQKHWRPFLADLEAGSDGASTLCPGSSSKR